MTPRRLLIVAYPFPPMPSIGANRWDAMARHLRREGHDVGIVTTSGYGRMRDPDQELQVLRAGDLTSAQWVRALFRRGPVPPPSDAPVGPAGQMPIESPLPPVLRTIFVPDLYVATWVPQALRLARRVVRRDAIDCVITTSPYESTHLLGPPLRRQGAAWIADFRDGWLFEPHRPPFPTAAQRALDRRMESTIVRGADHVLTATAPIAEDFRHRLGVDATHVANGFDPLKHPSLPELHVPELGGDTVALVYTGKLGGVNGRDPRGLFAAIRQLSDRDPQLGGRFRLVLAGRPDSEDLRLIADSGLGDRIVHLGPRSHGEALALQRRADALVLVASRDGSEVTGKLFEYLSAGRPIIALAGPSVETIVSSTATGVTVAPDDVDAIAEQLRRAASGELAADYRARDLDAYVYPGPARRVSHLIDQAITQRRAG